MDQQQTDDFKEPRLFRENGLAADIAALAEPVIEDLGLRIVRVVVSGRDGCTVQVMIERPHDLTTVEDCAQVSRQLSPLLDAHDPISARYNLEVSSPGIDRPLVRVSDFEIWEGFEVKIELREPIDGRKRFRGHLDGVENNEVRLKTQIEGFEGEQIIGLPLVQLESAKLVMTDELIKAVTQSHIQSGRDQADTEAGTSE